MIISPRWRKVLRDLTSNKSRTILVVSAIAIGVFAFGSVFITQDLLVANIQKGYRESNASNIWIYLSNFDSTLVNWVKGQPDVKDASGESTQTVKVVMPDGKKISLQLISVPDFSLMTMNVLKPQKGIWPPGKGELVLERSSISGTGLAIGDPVTIEIEDGRTKELTLVGSVYDNSAFPYMFTNQMGGYISWETLGFLGFPKRFNKLDILTGPGIKNLDDAEKFSFNFTEELKRRGVKVNGSMALRPNEHWSENNSKAFTAILSVVGVFSLVLSGFLVINTISALLSQQKKQVGVMKAIGAVGRQVTTLYLAMVAFYGLLALFIALPVGMLLGFGFLKLVANFLNLDIQTFYLPPSVALMEVAAALVIPILAALVPIIQGTKTSVRAAISDFQETKKAGRIERMLAKVGALPRPILISLRNVFRKKGRLILTLGTLITAGALFMSVLNVQTGMYKELDRILAMFDFQVSVNLDGFYSVAGLTERLKEIPNVTQVEGRTGIGARRIKSDGTKGSPFAISGLPPDTPFSHPVILSGRWLVSSDTNQIVLSSSLVQDNPDLTPGTDLTVSIGNDRRVFEVVGVIAMAGDQKIGFANFNTVAGINDKPGLASGFLIKTVPDDPKTQEKVGGDVETRLKRAGITVARRETKNQIYSGAAGQFNFMVFFLLAMAVMVAIVGGLGLAGTMSLNVLERTREIGIMRSIGASDGVIGRMVLIEGLLVGLISWIIAIPMSVPMTYGFCYAIGNAFFARTLAFTIVPGGMLIWFIIVVVIATIASVIPARRASKMRISETLSYE